MEATEARRVLIERLEALARERPLSYRVRVTALALFGLGYRVFLGMLMFAVPIAVTGAIYPSSWLLFIVVVGLLIFGLTWFGRSKLEGEPVGEQDAPALFAAVDALRKKIRAPRVHQVLLDNDFNAGAAQIPRLGIFGWYKQVLILGVPLLAALSREQLLAVVGHELGHFSKAHGRLGHWIYRIRLSWEKLNAGLGEEESGIGAAVNQFYRWFVPYFGAYSFALARANEYEADADAALGSDRASAATALAATHIYGGWLEKRFWPSLHRLALESSEPPHDAFERMASALRRIPEEELRTLQREALERASDLVDTHPSLAERLRALGMPEVRVQMPAASAGEALFGARWPEVLRRAGQAWRDANAQSWRDRHERVRGHSRRLAELERLPAAARGIAERIEIARIVQEIDGAEAALEHWRALVAKAPGHPSAALHYGWALVGLRDPQAFEVLDALASREPCYAAPALFAMRKLALDLGDRKRADRFDTRHKAAVELRGKAVALFEASYRDGGFDSPRLAAHAVDVLASQLQAQGTIAAAWLVALRPADSTPFGMHLLVVRIDPEAMNKLGADPVSIEERCAGLVESMLEPNELAAARNFYTTETIDEKVAAALAALPKSRLFGGGALTS
jgi:Zn-dependent protease with chaperone function